MFRNPLLLLTAFVALALAPACGREVTLYPGGSAAQVTPGCTTGAALILVGDGFLQNLCGCAEPDGTRVLTPSVFTCTVQAGTLVVFDYVTAGTSHQILSTGTPSFPDSPVADPAAREDFSRHAIQPGTPGSYGFTDAFDTRVSGTLVVL